MIRNPIDAATNVSPELSSLIEIRANDPDADQPVTLASIRLFLARELPAETRETEHMHHFDMSDSLTDELDALIDQFGEEAEAADFVRTKASEPLSRLIEAVLDDDNRENPPTLDAVREAILAGLPNRLVGEGVLEDDEDDNLLSEVESLIDCFGADALAEDFLRYE